MYLSKAGIRHVHGAVEKLFFRLKSIYLGSKLTPGAAKGVDKRIAVGFREDLSLPGLYRAAADDEGEASDETTLETIRSIAEGYIDAQLARTKSAVVKDIVSTINEAKATGTITNVRTALGGALARTFETVTTDVNRIIDTEAQNGRAIGTLEGIIRINEQSGVDDPTMGWIIVRDGHVCQICLELHQLSGTIAGPPRVWKMSEVGHGYYKRGDGNPRVSGLHPHCRCSAFTLLPGWGFNDAGMVTYIGPDHDEYAHQRGQSLAKSTREGISTFHALRDQYHANGERMKGEESKTATRHPDYQKISDAFHGAPITINLPAHVLSRVAETGRLQNLFETGTGGGSTNEPRRKQVENTTLGVPLNTIPDERPLYGALHVAHQNPNMRGHGGASSYGDCFLELKPHVKDRASFTDRDSFRTKPGEAVLYSHLPQLMHSWIHKNPDSAELLHSGRDGWLGGYVEAQIHGGVYPETDVAAVHVGRNVSADRESYQKEAHEHAINFGKKFGVPVYLHHYEEGQKLIHDPSQVASAEPATPPPPPEPSPQK